MPTNPEQGRQPKREAQPYYVASRFPTKQAAEQLYLACQKTIRTMDCDLSAYRFMRQWQEPNNNPWYVLVIGERPSDEIQQGLTTTLAREE